MAFSNDIFIFQGPPLTPNPVFRIVNATHIEVQWDKPFTLPQFDVRNFTLSIWNASFSDYGFLNHQQLLFSVSESTEYPIRHYISNEGSIPSDCVYLNFTLTASNDVGISSDGFTIGGFAIGNFNAQSYNYYGAWCFTLLIMACKLIILAR